MYVFIENSIKLQYIIYYSKKNKKCKYSKLTDKLQNNEENIFDENIKKKIKCETKNNSIHAALNFIFRLLIFESKNWPRFLYK